MTTPRAYPLALGLLGTALLAPLPVHAFGTINSLGQSAEHEKITRLALATEGFQPKTVDELAGKTGTWGAVGAPDNPARGLMGQASAHCDGGDFMDIPGYPNTAQAAADTLTACRTWTASRLELAVTAAGDLLDSQGKIRDSQIPTWVSCTYLGQAGRAKCNVMEALGEAFHAAQDFYSHSNWTDDAVAGGTTIDNPPGLGKQGRAPWLDPRASSAFPAGLMTGCYDGFPESMHCPQRVKHDVLNKDKGTIDVSTGAIGQGTTPRATGNTNFANAVTAAARDTRDKWVFFKERVVQTYGQQRGATIICAMLHDDPIKTCP